MANFWITNSNTDLIILQERQTIGYNLPLKEEYLPLTSNNMNISVISGEIPRGLRLEGTELKGTPFEVALDTRYTFVVRAEQFGIVDDRTYSIIVAGPDDPRWVTPEGLLNVSYKPNTYYILDNEIIDFQLEAIDPDTITGELLEYFIKPGNGQLPPGISLTKDGRLVGIVQPILAIEKAIGSGNFDEHKYASFPYDYGLRPDNGYDSFFFDNVVYDTYSPIQSPKKLNRFYEFIVTVTDGESAIDRKFRIYLVGDDFLRADNTIMKISTGVFTADNTYVRTPIWLTPANLGNKRANNYLTFYLDVLDPNTLVGEIFYQLQPFNNDETPSILPPGMSLDEYTGEITGKVPYQSAVTIEYKFTVRANRYVANTAESSFKDKTFYVKLIGEVESYIQWETTEYLGLLSSNYLSTLSVKATSNVANAILVYTLVDGTLPPGLQLTLTGEIIGKINSFGTSNNPGLTVFDSNNFQLDGNTTLIDREFKFTIKVQDHFGFSAITRTFNIRVTDPADKFYSNLYFEPLLNDDQRNKLLLTVTNSNIFNDKFIYRPNDPAFGVQRNLRMLVYAGIESKAIQYFVAAMAKNHKRKKYKLGEISVAVAKEEGTQNIIYEVIYINVIDPNENNKGKTKNIIKIRNANKRLVDTSMYDLEPDSVENQDPYGITFLSRRFGNVDLFFYPNLVVLTRNGQELIVNTKPISIGTRLNFNINAGFLITGTNEPYRLRPEPTNTIKVDSDAITIDAVEKRTKYISNITNMRLNIKKIGETELDFLPLWMKTAQEGSISNLGFVKAIPLCYCKPGYSKEIITNLKLEGLEFNEFTFEIDRYIIDSVEGSSQEQYLLFHNYDFNI